MAMAVCLTSCSAGGSTSAHAQSGPRRPAAVPVTIGKVERQRVPVEIRAIGNVQAYSTVQVKAMVAGELTRVYFREGQDVRKGDLLFTIDARPFQAALQQAEATRARDIAQSQNAQTDAQRYAELVKSGVVAQQQYDQMRTQAQALSAVVQADDAAIENAKLQLSYTDIRSPIDGRTGNLLVYQGNIIKANDVPLVVINQIQPIYVAFSVPGQNLDDIKRHMARGRLRVQAMPQAGGGPTETGALTFVDNNIDIATGTIQLKGTFPNTDRALWPGEFVTAVLTLTTEDAVVAPSAAVQNGQQGQYVFVVRPDLTVESRPVTVSRTIGTLSVIQKGLAPGDTVVTDGQLRLVPGAKISVSRGVAAQ